MLLTLFSLFIQELGFGISNKIGICANLRCDGISEKVCGIRTEGEGFRLKLFQSECDLLKHECLAKNDTGYEIISMDYCLEAFQIETDNKTSNFMSANSTEICIGYECSNFNDTEEICTIRNDGEGYRVRWFENKCELSKHNSENQVNFTITDLHICNGMQIPVRMTNYDEGINSSSTVLYDLTETVDKSIDKSDEIYDNVEISDYVKISDYGNTNNQTKADYSDTNTVKQKIEDTNEKTDKVENLIVIRSSVIDFNRINESVSNFFAATHVFDLPVKEMNNTFLNESTRRMLIKVARPVKVFVPWVTIPKNISNDFDHTPTLSTCYHKCPRKCPSTYAPVCGVPGIVAREPSLMFQNHCFMDVAQCKMFWENKSPTALSSSYVESSFLFCLGDEMNGMYRFLPLIRTLQHMGRLRKKGRFHYRFKNLKFFNNMLSRQPKFMG